MDALSWYEISTVIIYVSFMVGTGWVFCYKPLQQLNRAAADNASRQPQYAKDE